MPRRRRSCTRCFAMGPSHSCEGAFAHLTGSNNGQITQAMIFNSSVLPAKYHLGRLLDTLDLDRESVGAC